jgi:FMN phosphatase YigB (HAD superfamily)
MDFRFLMGFMGFFIFPAAHGAIHATDQVANVAHVFHAGDMVIFDLDNTVFVSHHTFGSDRWFEKEISLLEEQGYSRQDAILTAQRLADATSLHTEHSHVEEDVRQIILDLQGRGVTVFALTARRPIQAEETFRALEAVDVDFKATSPSLDNLDSFHYQNGVLFAAAQPKGPVLVKFLEAIRHQPSSVVFIDDRLENVHSVVHQVEALNISVQGIHYSAHEKVLTPYRQDVVELQRKAMLNGERVPTDLEAIEILDGSKGSCTDLVNPESDEKS